MSAPNEVTGPAFTDTELDRVEDDLVRILENHRWDPGVNGFFPGFFEQQLRERGHTLARIEKTFDRLLKLGVFMKGVSREVTPVCSSRSLVEIGEELGVVERTDHRLEEARHPIEWGCYDTTSERWFGYVNERRARNARSASREVGATTSDLPSLEDFYTRQSEEIQRREEEARLAWEPWERYLRLNEPFGPVECWIYRTMRDGTTGVDEFAAALIELARVLSAEGELAKLIGRVERPLGGESDHQLGARTFVAHLIRLAANGDVAAIAAEMRKAGRMPFMSEADAWFYGRLRRTLLGFTPFDVVEDGICWPEVGPGSLDPLEPLARACGIAADAIVKPAEERPKLRHLINRLWQIVFQVAARLRRTPPEWPGAVLSVPSALSAVEVVVAWIGCKRPGPSDPVAEMRESIRRERSASEALSDCSSGINWQSRVDRLWERWRSLFPLKAPPPRPVCRTNNEASDAVDALLRALEGRPEHGTDRPDQALAYQVEKQPEAMSRSASAHEEPRPMSIPTYTFGQLLEDVVCAESASPLNQPELDRIRREHGSAAAAEFMLQVSALGARPCLRSQPGGNEVELACDELSGGQGVTAAALRLVRVSICRRHRLLPSDVDSRPLSEVAALLNNQGGDSAASGPIPQPTQHQQGEEPVRQSIHPNEVEAGRWLWWQGKRYDLPKGVIARLIGFMWDKTSAHYDDLNEHVFGDPVEPASVRARASEANGHLRTIGIPWELKPDSVNRYLTKESRSEAH